MNRNFRFGTLQLLAKKAGILFELVQKTVNPKITQKLPKVQMEYANITVGSGTRVIIPTQPVKPDGSVNVMFQFRGGSPALFSKAGVNTVIVQADAGGIGGGPSRKAYGNPEFINQAVNKVINYLSEKTGQKVTLGKLGLSGFSGGYDPIHGILEAQQKGWGKLIKEPDYVGLFDGMHHSIKPNSPAMQVWESLAQKAVQGKTKFVITHSAIKPSYSSTTETSQYLLDRLNMKRQRVSGAADGQHPLTVASSGNFNVYQLYDQPAAAKGKAVPGSAEYQHIQALRSMPNYWPTDWDK